MKHKPTFHPALSIFFASAILATACDTADTTEPSQVVESNVDPSTVESLLAAAELGDGGHGADYRVYTATWVGVDITPSARRVDCPLDAVGPIESECGYCQCQPDGNVACIDYSCDLPPLGFEPPPDDEEPPYILDQYTPAPVEGPVLLDQYTAEPAFCEDGHAVGASWWEVCNICFCDEDRTINCTQLDCDEFDR